MLLYAFFSSQVHVNKKKIIVSFWVGPACVMTTVRYVFDVMVQSTHVVQKSVTSTTPAPDLLSPLPDESDGPRAEALVSPNSLRNWLKRIQVPFLTYVVLCCKAVHSYLSVQHSSVILFYIR